MKRRTARGGFMIIAVAAALAAQSAPAPPATVTLAPHWRAGSVLAWRIAIHSSLTRDTPGQTASASLDNRTLAQMKIVSLTPTGAIAALSILSYKTEVSGLDALATQLRNEEDQLAARAPQLAPVRVEIVNDGENRILSAPPGEADAEIVNLLEQLARTDTLPAGATAVGAHWTRQRVENLATLHFGLPTTLRCTLQRLAWTPAGWQAVIGVATAANSSLPPSSIPNFAALAGQGYAAQASLEVTGTATARYLVASGMLTSADSQTHNLLRIELTGPQAKPLEVTTRIDSTGSVRQEGLTPRE